MGINPDPPAARSARARLELRWESGDVSPPDVVPGRRWLLLLRAVCAVTRRATTGHAITLTVLMDEVAPLQQECARCGQHGPRHGEPDERARIDPVSHRRPVVAKG
jgi:hypothetical protein